MITKKTEYAIKALCELARRNGNLMTSNEIAQRQAIPPKYLPQIIAELSQAGLITSVRGYGGGLKLKRTPDEITLMEVIEAIQGRPNMYECQNHQVDCMHLPNCELRSVYSKAQTALETVFQSTRLSDIKFTNSKGS
jgi:Rrf2 family protein